MIEQQLQFLQSRLQPVSTEDLPEPMPTISRRKIILTDHWEYEHFGACCLPSVDHPYDEHFGANQDEDDWKSSTERILSVPWVP